MQVQFLALLAYAAVACAYALPATLVTDETRREEYDYIVVGGGTSGLTIASRLSENPKISVLVIEAGPLVTGDDEFNFISIPRRVLASGARWQWNVTSLPNKELGGTQTTVIVPRLVGGGSALNGMQWDRGSRRDYDDWAKYVDDPGWGWDELLKYFRKSETFTPPSKDLVDKFNITWDPAAHGNNGPIKSTYPPFIYPHFKTFQSAEEAIGVPVPLDHTNGEALGSYWTPNSLDAATATRSYSKTAYHEPAKGRPNYHLLTDRTVTRIIFRRKTAVGVEYAAGPDSDRIQARAKREVILAAGGVYSPRLLQLSGVGDRRLLRKFNISIVEALEGVGQGYQDHSGATMQHQLTLDPDPAALRNNQTYNDEMLQLYLTNRPYTVSAGNHLSFYSFPLISPRYKELLAAAAAQDDAKYLPEGTPPTVLAGYKKQKAILLESFATTEMAINENVITLSSTQHPLSRGFVEISSADPFAKPNVDWRTLSNPFDIAVIIEGVKFIRRIIDRPELASWKASELTPGRNATSDADIEKWVRTATSPTFWHSSCSCAMGDRKLGGVVDTKLRVHGVQRLRIVDASIMPFIPATHLQHTVFAVAERAADLIKKDQ